MDDTRFDTLTRQLPALFNRRQLSRTGVAALFGVAGLTAVTGGEAKKKKCKNGKKRCKGKCTNIVTNRKNCGQCGKRCGAGEICVSGKCAVSCSETPFRCVRFGNDVRCRVTGDGRRACLQNPPASCAALVVESCAGNPCQEFGKVCAEASCPEVSGSLLTCLTAVKG